MEIGLLLRLVVAHLLTDFVFQPKSWVKDREEKGGKSNKLYLHIVVTTVFAYIFSGKYDNWIIPLVIFVTHLIIDYIKSKTDKNKFSYFIIDQIAHLLVIILLWLFLENKWPDIQHAAELLLTNSRVWTVTAGYIFISWPLGIIIGKATQKWRDQITKENLIKAEATQLKPEVSENHEDETIVVYNPEDTFRSTDEHELGLANAGKWIGICERILILTFILIGQYTAIGFLMTAKSILRFSEKETNTQLKTEYILVGTLVSFASSAMAGVLIQLILQTNLL